MFQWIYTEASKLRFGCVIKIYDNGSDRIGAFVTLACERNEKYRPSLQNFKREETCSRGYWLTNNKWKFNVICGLHNHDLCEKLVGDPIPCRLMPKEKKYVYDMTLNLVQPKNILATLKCKRLGNIVNIRQVLSRRYQTKLALKGDITETSR
ncbi:uncharacterized protein LOC131638361 [Vicia villosa]|uniref:uncharacterized protein LOC131638361 n=1 Tax=Vicia villosa TaxID=3911 RepID=UPI00273C861C|nr:uncharacterized protein LOC131638361 [Vicia villosa]